MRRRTSHLRSTIFLLDIVITFFVPYKTSVKRGGIVVFDHRRIASHYLRTWFLFDLMTAIPFDLLVSCVAVAQGWDTSASSKTLIQLLRIVRLAKLLRIVRVRRIIKRWQDHVSISFALLSLTKFIFLTIILAHWLAVMFFARSRSLTARWSSLDADAMLACPFVWSAQCGWGFIAITDSDEVWTGYDEGLSWKQKAQVKTTNEFELYGVALYVALNNIFGGSCEINPGNYHEFFVQGLMLLTGSSVWAYVIGSACGIVATLDPAGIEHRQVLDEVNGFCREEGLPEELSVKLRSYFRDLRRVFRSRRHNALLSQMSTRLRGDTAMLMCAHHLKAVPFLVHHDLEPEFMCNLAIRYATVVFSRLERVPCVNLFIVERGVVAKRGSLGVAGTCFGQDVILSNNNLRDTSDAIALTFLQAISLTQADIFDLCAC